MSEKVLTGGSMTAVVRVGNTVRRTAGPWTPTIHMLLRHLRGNGFVLEALPFHHVAPVAGGIADGEENGFVLRAGCLEGLRAPWIPVNRIVGVLEEIWRGLLREAVGMLRQVRRIGQERLLLSVGK